MGMAVSALCEGPVTLNGSESLTKRPVGALAKALRSLGAHCTSEGREGYPPVTIRGPLRGGEASIPGSESSQYLSALLLACPLSTGDTTITLTSPLESKPYVDMTVECLNHFGGTIEAEDRYDTIHIRGNQSYVPRAVTVEGDYSSAAFMLAAGALAGKVTVGNMPHDTTQGDMRIIDLLSSFGADLTRSGDTVTAVHGALSAISADCSDIPDLVPILAAVATQASGTTKLTHIGRLRIKESDRIATTMQELTRMGASIKADETTLYIHGPTRLHGARIATHDDHRIAMSCAVAALVAEGSTTIEDVECVNKSYPAFFSDLASLGGIIRGE
jgi:3-phosphoshikimate 1-carboxyvinyltransferase